MIPFSLLFFLFLAGLLTILLPCILPLLPIAVGAGIADRHPLRPLALALGMVVGFVGITFILYVFLSSFILLADLIQIGTLYVLLLFGIAFLTERVWVQRAGAALGGLFFITHGSTAIVFGALLGIAALQIGGNIAGKLQQAGADVQQKAAQTFGSQSLFTAFLFGLTMGLVWVPCAGPALGYALALVRTQPGFIALLGLTSYAVGAAIPVLLLGYGGQWLVTRFRGFTRFTGRAKHIAGGIFILTAIALRMGWLLDLQTYLVNNTTFGTFGTRLEETFFPEEPPMPSPSVESNSSSSTAMPSSLPKLTRAPEFTGLGPWHNTEPFTMESLRGKVVLVDFWTYSCINCIRTLPYIRQYAEKYKNEPFVLIGVHTPEFIFEKSEQNVAAAIKKHNLVYPVAQDNDFATWDAFANRYWPAKYLIDKDGYIRYTHFGEGAYDETDMAIQSLLREAGETVSGVAVTMPESKPRRPISAETYLHSRSWPAFGNGPLIPTDALRTYEEPMTMQLHKYYLVGNWQLLDDERMVLRSDTGDIRMKWLGGEINLVLGLEEGMTPVTGEVWIDGKMVKTITIKEHDLYNLFTGEYGEHELVLKLSKKGVSGYAFTFGS